MFGVEKGTIFVADHGYDIVHNSFYQVESVTPSGKSVKVVKIEKETVQTGPYFTKTERPILNSKGFGIPVSGKTSTYRLQDWEEVIKEDGEYKVIPSAMIKLSEFTNGYVWNKEDVAGGGMN